MCLIVLMTLCLRVCGGFGDWFLIVCWGSLFGLLCFVCFWFVYCVLYLGLLAF